MDNVAVDVVEFRQALDMVANTTKRITKSITALRNRNVLGAARALWGPKLPKYKWKGGPDLVNGSLADNWLELQYGWKPLLQDVHGSFAALAKLNLANTAVMQVRSSATVRNKTASRLGTGSYAGGYGQRVDETYTTCKLKLEYRLASPMLNFLQQIGFTNPVDLAWEILPFSFVVDWFLPVGNFLESLTTWQGLTFLRGNKTLFSRRTTYFDASWEGRPIGSPSYVTQGIHGGLERFQVLYDRTPLLGFPGNRLPSFKNPFSVTHVANGLGLMAKAFH